jgi:glycosyltransferase involved in cell wall biosynthesis
MPVYFASKIKRVKRMIDLHELFCDMQELVHQPLKRKFWLTVERLFISKFAYGYSVSTYITDHYKQNYGRHFSVISNYPCKRPVSSLQSAEKYILYQGAIVEGRHFETMIEASRLTGYPLYICGNGGQYAWLKASVDKHNHKHVRLFGAVEPKQLHIITENAWIGLNLLSADSKSYRYSAANRFYDYIQAGIPQISSDYPVYNQVNSEIEVAVLLEHITVQEVSDAIKKLENPDLYDRLRKNAAKAAEIYTWNRQEPLLKQLYADI